MVDQYAGCHGVVAPKRSEGERSQANMLCCFAMHFVYSLESEDGAHWYVGVTDNVDHRLSEHNAGLCTHTNKHKPWIVKGYTEFIDHKRASTFELFLKSHSGRAFAKKHL